MKLGKITYATLALIISMLVVGLNEVSAQYYRRNSYRFTDGLSVSFQFGPSIYAGDMGYSFPFFNGKDDFFGGEIGNDELEIATAVDLTYGIGLEKEILEYLNVRLQFNSGNLRGDRRKIGQDVNYRFRSTFYEASLGGVIDINNLISGYYSYRVVNFYAVIAPTFLLWNSGLDGNPEFSLEAKNQSGNWQEVWNRASDGFTGGIDYGFVIKGGGGIKVRIDDKWSLMAEYTGNFAFSDNLDHYAKKSSGEDTDGNDFYYVGQVGLSYKLGPTTFRSKSKYNRKSYAHRYKKLRYKGRSKRRR